MANSTKTPSSTKVVTGIVRFSYLHVWEPAAMEGSDVQKYSASLIINKDDEKTLSAIRAAIASATEAYKASHGGTIPVNFRTPLRDGDADRPDDASYKGKFFVNASSNTKPGIVDRNASPILDQSELYSGCFGRASINFYPFDKKGGKGIACGLNNLQKVRDGESLGGRSRAEDDFTAVEGDDDLV